MLYVIRKVYEPLTVSYSYISKLYIIDDNMIF